MSGKKKVNFKAGVEALVRNYYTGLKIENPGIELIAKVINEVNSLIVASIEQDFKSAKLVDERVFRHIAQKAVTNIFAGNLQKNALSESHKQLALLQSGCMTYGDGEKMNQQLKRMRERETSDRVKRGKTEKIENNFKMGIKKAFTNLLPNLTLDARGAQLLGHRIPKFARIVAEEAAKAYEKKDELQPVDIKNIISKYLEVNALKAANSEGNKCLVMFENGLLDFKPRRTVKSGWSQESVDIHQREEIFTSVFKPGIRSILNDTNPDASTDGKAPKYLAHVMMDVAKYLAEATGDYCKKKKISEMGMEEMNRAVTLAFPEQLRQHAILHASGDVAKYMEGLLLYEKDEEKPTRRKDEKSSKSADKSALSGAVRKSKKSPKRLFHSRQHRSLSRRAGSKSSATHSGKKKSPSTPRKPRIQAPRPKKSVLAPMVDETLPAIFPGGEVSLAKDAKNNAGGVLEDVSQALMSVILSNAEDGEELGRDQVIKAIMEVFPNQLAQHAAAFALNSKHYEILPENTEENSDADSIGDGDSTGDENITSDDTDAMEESS